MDQDMICVFKALCIRESLQRNVAEMNSDKNFKFKENSRNFTIATCLLVIHTALKCRKTETPHRMLEEGVTRVCPGLRGLLLTWRYSGRGCLQCGETGKSSWGRRFWWCPKRWSQHSRRHPFWIADRRRLAEVNSVFERRRGGRSIRSRGKGRWGKPDNRRTAKRITKEGGSMEFYIVLSLQFYLLLVSVISLRPSRMAQTSYLFFVKPSISLFLPNC